jgi:hypothetical protein
VSSERNSEDVFHVFAIDLRGILDTIHLAQPACNARWLLQLLQLQGVTLPRPDRFSLRLLAIALLPEHSQHPAVALFASRK